MAMKCRPTNFFIVGDGEKGGCRRSLAFEFSKSWWFSVIRSLEELYENGSHQRVKNVAWQSLDGGGQSLQG